MCSIVSQSLIVTELLVISLHICHNGLLACVNFWYPQIITVILDAIANILTVSEIMWCGAVLSPSHQTAVKMNYKDQVCLLIEEAGGE